MSIKKHLSLAVAVLAITLAAATSFAPPAHAAFIDENVNAEFLADGVERLKGKIEEYAEEEGNLDRASAIEARSFLRKAREDGQDAVDGLLAGMLKDGRFEEVPFESDAKFGMASSLLTDGTVSLIGDLAGTNGFSTDKREAYYGLFVTALCYESVLEEQLLIMESLGHGPWSTDATFADDIEYLDQVIELLRAGELSEVNKLSAKHVARYQVRDDDSGTLVDSAGDALPFVLATAGGIVVGAAGFAVASRIREK